MKKLIFLFSILFLTANLYSQNYLISFAATGVTTPLDSVKVENLTQATNLTLLGSDILHLGNVGVNDIINNENKLQISPNPMQGNAELSFYAKKTGNTQLYIYDITGKKTLQFSDKHTQGIQKYKLTGLKQGIYFINIIGDNYLYSAKLISLNTDQNEATIEYLGFEYNTDINNKLKSTNATITMAYTNGDNLRFTGFSGNKTAIIMDVPTTSKTITFTFTALIPIITTNSVSSITSTSAISGGSISSDGGAIITARGVCWSVNSNPTIADSKTTNGTGVGSFTSSLTGLFPGTTYYVRAYATNSIGTAYGNEVSLTCLAILPTLTTSSVSSITSVGAISGGNITNNGGATITVRGVCWGTTVNPTTANNKTIDGNGNGVYTSSISGLSPGITYYLRAYATNTIGTAYGNQLSFTSLTVLPSLTTTAAFSISGTTASSGGNISSNGGATVTSRGVCWNTSANPTILNSKTIDSSGIGIYTSSLTGLIPNTNYYLRAYATNSVGTNYGNEIIFTTASLAIGNPYQGGVVAYILLPGDPGYVSGQTKALIATPSNQSIGSQWGGSGSVPPPGAYDTVIGTGNQNTITIMAAVSTAGIAARICGDLVLNGYNDWYLPSKAELNILYLNKVAIGGFSNNNYWSSSEPFNSWASAYAQNFQFGNVTTSQKVTSNYVRAIRTFPSTPCLTTNNITNITDSSAISGGIVAVDGGSSVIARGICWSTTTNPTTANNKTIDSVGTGLFASLMNGLIPGTIYYVRAYATNSIGTSYGNEVSFTSIAVLPIVSTSPITLITSTSAISGGNITYNGGSNITSRGVCWSDSHVPTILDYITTNGNGSGVFTSSISQLQANTMYYVRAFATNSIGTSYGDIIAFATLAPVLATITSTPVSLITGTTASSGGNINSNGGATITSRGVCWNTSSNPTIANSKTIDGTGNGLFVSSLTGLSPANTYYVRAYATNSAGTAYGNELIFSNGIGVSYQGGIIAYILQPGDPGYIAGQTHGLIAAPSDQSGGAQWGCYNSAITGADGTGIGTGNQNTIDIMAGCSTAGIAARICGNLVLGGYSDWYLPSINELSKLYINRVAIGGFNSGGSMSGSYWSSSESNYANALIFVFYNGVQSVSSKSSALYVRAIRYF